MCPDITFNHEYTYGSPFIIYQSAVYFERYIICCCINFLLVFFNNFKDSFICCFEMCDSQGIYTVLNNSKIFQLLIKFRQNACMLERRIVVNIRLVAIVRETSTDRREVNAVYTQCHIALNREI